MSLDNFVLLFTGQHEYWTWFFNSIFLTALTVLLTLAVSAFVGYGFAAYEFKGKRVFFVIVLLILSIPLEVVMLPLYKQMSVMKLMDSYTAIVLPFIAHASTIFFFRQYLLSLPKSLLEAGRIDGATEYGIFFKADRTDYEAGVLRHGNLKRHERMEQLPVAAAGNPFFG